MLKRTFKALTNRFLRCENRNLPEEAGQRDTLARTIVAEIDNRPIVLNGTMWFVDGKGQLKRVKVRVME